MTTNTRAITTFPAERLRAFVDAVVAIAMTLLILPLMEAASEAGKHQAEHPNFGTREFFAEHDAQFGALALSFALIAMAWIMHHRLYAVVERVTIVLLWLNVLWMFMIVCLPVTTALVGALRTDGGLVVAYVGNLILLQLSSLLGRLYLLRHLGLTSATRRTIRHGVLADGVAVGLFVVALVLSLTIPVFRFTPLFLLALTDPITRLLSRDADPAPERPGA